jgi:hypothetical protein
LAAAGAAAAPERRPALPSLSILAITWSAVTVPPSATTISASTPALGAGTSSTTLSVSISIRISSCATASPAFFFHCNRVASATDSDSWGTFTSTIAICVFLCSWSRAWRDLAPRTMSAWGLRSSRAAREGHFVRTKPLSLPNAPSTSAFCCSWCRCE